MVDIVEDPSTFPGVHLLEVGEQVKGGLEGAANKQAIALVARTGFLKAQLEALVTGGLTVKGTLASKAELDAIDTSTLKKGDAYWVEYELWVWNLEEWIGSGDLRGDRGVNLLGTWPTAVPLPDPSQNKVGDGYIWMNDIWVLVPYLDPQDPEAEPGPPVWEALGIRGAPGESTFETWRKQPGNAGKTQAEFLAEQKGDPGDDAYEVWLTIPGNEGKTKPEWVEATRGIQGEEGPARAPFAVAGTKPNTAALPQPGDTTEAWYVGIDLYVWVEADGNYTMIPGVAGKSAYQGWVELPGNEGKTEAEFYASLKGAKGEDSTVPGPKGADGRNLRILGTVANEQALYDLVDPEDQDAYATLDTGNLWIFLSAVWVNFGPWRGVDGKSAYEVWVDDGHEGQSLSDYYAFLKGKDGLSMKVTAVVATQADFPVAPEEQWIYAVQDIRSFFIYLNTQWTLLGTYGKDGEDGENGTDGKSLDIIKVMSEGDQVVPPANEETKGKAYVAFDPRNVWVNTDGTAWYDAGPFMPLGEQGIQGVAWRPKGTVQTLQGLPQIGGQNGAKEGDTYSVLDDGKRLYTVVDGQWSGPLDIVGPQGGIGPQGTPGALMPILGMYETIALLRTAHPTGSLGDAYLLVNAEETYRNLAIWSVDLNDWLDTGPAGIPGQRGLPGNDSTVPGPQGEKGSQWLTLDTQGAPSNAFNGRTGDWAVNRLNRIYYKTPTGWIYWGQLVAGDVNSPDIIEGKVVRLGTEWVPLPVDNPPADGKHYLRSRATGQDTGTWLEGVEELTVKDGKIFGRKWDTTQDPAKFVWVEIVIPASIADLSTKDGKQYARVFETNGNAPIWKEIVTIADVTTADGKYYARFKPAGGGDTIWKEVPAGITDIATKDGKYYARVFETNGSTPIWKEVPASIVDLTNKDGKQYVRVYETNGSEPIWKEIVAPKFDRYTVKMVPATTELDLGVAQVFKIANSSARTLTWKTGTQPPVGESQTVVLIIDGAGTITWPANITWSGNTPPAPTTGTIVVTLVYDSLAATPRWLGSTGYSN